MKTTRELRKGELEVVWNSGRIEQIQTDGMTSNGAAIVATIKGHQLVIPLTSIQYFRVRAIG